MTESKKVAIITGAGSGIGKSTALALAKEGYVVVAAGRRLEPLHETVTEVEKQGGSALAISSDVSQPDSVKALFIKTSESYARLDLLFNNAGIGAPSGLLEDLSYDEWQAVVDINLTGSFLCTQEAFKIMKDQDPRGGRIINNGSVSAHVPRTNSAPYTATKHAITGLTRSSSLDGRKYNIACGQLDIGNALVERTTSMQEGKLQPNGETVPEPTIDPKEVARAVVYMASLPLDANVQFMTVMATQMPYIGRG
ncbi:SDR family oxidoreductase [Opitutia bacterium ISCC 51]|nr:SDR family oxidoreductase [Opitutae bacterium ISCC 51]QXD29339.1 SDR family oxidoreductase [Opitutae bacterium ISCC 52]